MIIPREMMESFLGELAVILIPCLLGWCWSYMDHHNRWLVSRASKSWSCILQVWPHHPCWVLGEAKMMQKHLGLFIDPIFCPVILEGFFVFNFSEKITFYYNTTLVIIINIILLLLETIKYKSMKKIKTIHNFLLA